MQCRSCGSQIADKAIVCYRCGAATTDPVRRPAAARTGRRPVASMIAAAVLLVAAAVVAYFAQTAPDPETWGSISAVLAGAGIVVLILGLLRRRRS